MQFLLGAIMALVIVTGAFCFFMKHTQLSILFVAQNKKCPIFLKSKDLRTGDLINVQYSGIGALGTVMNLGEYSAEVLAQFLNYKSKDQLRIIIKSRFPEVFHASKINQSIVILLNILIEASDTRRPANVDDTMNVIKTYIEDCQRYWTGTHSMSFTGQFSPDFTSSLILRKLKWKSTIDENLIQIYQSTHKPWQKDV